MSVRWLARLVSWLFYRIDCVGSVPAEGAVLLLANHFNALLDPAVIWATAGRDVRFLAKSTLFSGPLRPLLVAARAIPVYRRLDQGVDTSRNEETFDAVRAALDQDDAICLFPEGISHSTGHLEPLRTGAARMALAAERAGTRVALVPVGLNFDRRAVFRSRAIVVFGAAFSARDLLPHDPNADAEAVRRLTERVAEHMRRLLVEADPAADAALVDRVDRLYAAARARPRDPASRLARRKLIAAGLERLRHEAPQRYEAILLELRRYDAQLARLGLGDHHLDWRVSPLDAARFALRELVFALFLLPLAATGAALLYVPYKLTGFLARRITRHGDLLATVQIFAGAVVYGSWFALSVAVAGWLAGRTAAWAALALLLPFSILALFAIERESAVWHAVRSWIQLRRAREEVRAGLRQRRSELADVLDDVRDWLAG